MGKYSKVAYIEVGKTKIPFRVSFRVIDIWRKETGKQFEELDDLMDDFGSMSTLFYHAVIAGYEAIDKKCGLSKKDINDILDDYWLDFIAGIGDFFQSGVARVAKKQNP